MDSYDFLNILINTTILVSDFNYTDYTEVMQKIIGDPTKKFMRFIVGPYKIQNYIKRTPFLCLKEF